MSLKTITATVGEGGANIATDVAMVQYLLNCVPVSHGGPMRELKIDGFAGVVTTEAINHFQKVHFGQSNSRLESGGNAFSELIKYDPLPYSAPVILPNFKPSNSQSKRNCGEKSSADEIGAIYVKYGSIYVKKSIDGGGIKRALGDSGGIKQALDGVKRA